MNGRLIVAAGPQSGTRFELEGESTLGRSLENRIVLEDRAVSRRQCVVLETASGYSISDSGSRNPTRVNGVAIGEAALRSGDQIEVGQTVLLFEAASVDDEITDVGDLEATLACEPPAERKGLDTLQSRLLAAPTTGAFVQVLVDGILERTPARRAYVAQLDRMGEPVPLLPTPGMRLSKRLVRQAVVGLRAYAAIASQADSGTLLAQRISAAMVAPIVAGDVVRGVVYAERDAGAFTEEDLELLAVIADLAAGPLEALLRVTEVEQENRRLRAAGLGASSMVGSSESMVEVNRLIQRVAPADTTVLITGESGTGKELVARALHARGRRAKGPFLAVNCAAFPEALLESELFGHEKGAFTGAAAARKGLMEEASGGTFFLDEIGEMPIGLQAKLLRVLQEKQVQRVGGSRPISIDVRIVAATNRDLQECIRQRTFREDLFYRLKVITIQTPPLRERREDIELLARHFLRKHSARMPTMVREISAEALRLLERYEWPGNVRELENAIERAVVLAETDCLLPDDFADLIAEVEPAGGGTDWHSRLVAAKRRIVEESLAEAGGKQAEAARILGLHPNNLRRLMRQLGVVR